MSRPSFARNFERALGQTPMQYLTDCRLTLAREYLLANEFTLGRSPTARDTAHRTPSPRRSAATSDYHPAAGDKKALDDRAEQRCRAGECLIREPCGVRTWLAGGCGVWTSPCVMSRRRLSAQSAGSCGRKTAAGCRRAAVSSGVPELDLLASLRGPVIGPPSLRDLLPLPAEEGPIDGHHHLRVDTDQVLHDHAGHRQPERVDVPGGVGENQHARRHRWATPAAAASATTMRRPPARITPRADAMNNSCVERRRTTGANSAGRPPRTRASVLSPAAASVDTPIIGGVQNTTDAAPLNDHPRSSAARQRFGGLVDGGEPWFDVALDVLGLKRGHRCRAAAHCDSRWVRSAISPRTSDRLSRWHSTRGVQRVSEAEGPFWLGRCRGGWLVSIGFWGEQDHGYGLCQHPLRGIPDWTGS